MRLVNHSSELIHQIYPRELLLQLLCQRKFHKGIPSILSSLNSFYSSFSGC